MRAYLLVVLNLFFLVTACTPIAPPSTLVATPTLISCTNFKPGATSQPSLLPTFTPAYACQLEQAYQQVNDCLVQASPELSYPCSRTEAIQETLLGQSDGSQLIQRDYQFSAGCWHSISSDNRSLKVCDSRSGDSTLVMAGIFGDLLPSPDKMWFAFAAATAKNEVAQHLYLVRADGSELIQLDTQPLPWGQIVGSQFHQWSTDGAWVEVSLWDGRQGGWHRYRLRTDGSGEFIQL